MNRYIAYVPLRQLQNIGDIDSKFRSGRIYTLVNVTVAVVGLGLTSMHFSAPFVAPPLGPTLFIIFGFPLAQESEPRNVLLGHLIGVLAGIGALACMGLIGKGANLDDLTWERLCAITIAVALTLTLLPTFRILHIPAVSTTLLVAMGLLQPDDWPVFMSSVVLLVIYALTINRAFGIRMPYWARPKIPQVAATTAV